MERGRPFEEIEVGEKASITHAVTIQDIEWFAEASGDRNTIHFSDEAAREAGFEGRAAHGVLSLGFCSAVLGTKLPGPGTVAVSLDVKFLRPVYPGEEIKAEVMVREKNEERGHLVMGLIWKNPRGKTVCRGTAVVIPPRRTPADDASGS